MSNVNIKRAIENIRYGTNVYSPLVETIVNAIQAIDSRRINNGLVEIFVKRASQKNLGDGLSAVESFTVKDNGIGFNEINRQAFDTLYTDHKISQGGKGFGRFTCLKYFEDMKIDSIFESQGRLQRRSFKMGKNTDFIENETVEPCQKGEPGTLVTLQNIKGKGFPDKPIKTIARILVERLLPYFIDDDYDCPKVTICEVDGSDLITLNDFFNNQISESIHEIQLEKGEFDLGKGEDVKTFSIHVFKIFNPRSNHSKVSLVADRREVTETSIHTFVPEFVGEFYEESDGSNEKSRRNYVVKAYVFGRYLDESVSLERGKFEFPTSEDLIAAVSQSDIEREAARIARESMGAIITVRQEKKRTHVQDYVAKHAPWHSTIVEEIDLTLMPYRPSPEQIEEVFQKEKFKQEFDIRKRVSELLNKAKTGQEVAGLPSIIKKISQTSRNDLIHYIANRKQILSLFSNSIQSGEDDGYFDEGQVHDIIFPRRSDSKSINFEAHNLWMIDERLNFTDFVSSDQRLDGDAKGRADLIVFDNRVLFRGDNTPSNPVTIFEFKRPGRDDFANPSSKDDPIQQVIRYANKIREGKYKTPKGRPIDVSDNTPFYGYVMCETTKKVKNWLDKEKNFTPMPDGLGWFHWYGNIRLYLEVLSWDKVLRDAENRNKIFFRKLGID